MRSASAPRTEPAPPPALNAALERRALGAYLGLAVGDALGATVEFMTPREIRARHGLHEELTGGGWLGLAPGAVTDDTQMSLALGDAIIAEQGRVVPATVAAAFDAWMRSKPVDIGHTVRRGLMQYRQHGSTQAPYSEYGAGNGACMRTLPVALATLGARRAEVAQAACAQAQVTHNNELSDAGTLVIVELVQKALSGAALEDIEDQVDAFVHAHPAFAFRTGRAVENPGGFIVDTLRAVFQALFAHRSFAPALIAVVNRGGDADTTGAILGMVAGAVHGVDAIPRRWLRRLDPEVTRACARQVQALLALSPAALRG
jgi:ADP-ribosyl-[dinitrogen reductase] hydrolase